MGKRRLQTTKQSEMHNFATNEGKAQTVEADRDKGKKHTNRCTRKAPCLSGLQHTHIPQCWETDEYSYDDATSPSKRNGAKQTQEG